MPTSDEIGDLILRGLAHTRDADLNDLQQRARQGDLVIDSKEAECVIAYVEDELGVGELASSTDLTPEQLTSLKSLTKILTREARHKVA
jgi:hypothetical protein